LTLAVDVVSALAANPYIPRVVQITSRQDDVYGRHYYFGQDDRGRSERIFTPLPLAVRELYMFFPLTNPARINPLIFPYSTSAKYLTSDDPTLVLLPHVARGVLISFEREA
jgi:hypothetical protein